MDIEIQLAEAKDLPVIKELIKSGNLSTNLLKCRYVLKACLGDRIVGTVSMEYHGRYAVLRALIVRKDLRRQGIGSSLVRRCIEIAKADDILGIYLLTYFWNMRFFCPLGFELKKKRQGLPEAIDKAWQLLSEKYKRCVVLGFEEGVVPDPVKETIECYEVMAEDYSQKHLDPEVMRPQLEFFTENLRGKKILDVGCGSGRDAKYFTDRGFEVVGIDLSDELLRIAQRVAPKATFLKMDMRDLDFPSESFDGLWACASLLHILKKEVPATLRGFCHILKPDGFLYLCVKEGKGESWSEFGDSLRSFTAFYCSEELRQLVEEAGFEIIRIAYDFKHATFIDVFARPRR